jgi:hypothetical protein
MEKHFRRTRCGASRARLVYIQNLREIRGGPTGIGRVRGRMSKDLFARGLLCPSSPAFLWLLSTDYCFWGRALHE